MPSGKSNKKTVGCFAWQKDWSCFNLIPEEAK